MECFTFCQYACIKHPEFFTNLSIHMYKIYENLYNKPYVALIMGRTKVTIVVDDDMWRRVKAFAAIQSVSMSSVVETALRKMISTPNDDRNTVIMVDREQLIRIRDMLDDKIRNNPVSRPEVNGTTVETRTELDDL